MNHRLNEYKAQTRDRLNSDQGLEHRKRRCIEPEAVFGQFKANMGYRRFRHMGLEQVKMDFAFLAMAFNLKKLCAKLALKAKNTPKSHIKPQSRPDKHLLPTNTEKSYEKTETGSLNKTKHKRNGAMPKSNFDTAPRRKECFIRSRRT